ncbi:hypothetical protein [Geoalkalibacter sp.]|uniref:hypothetical protein n=1 Tax=Geoalkalibacter sp. TaxID=3041440 RepID=UPI00272EC329|nr:hypothetical protein [Geoalkalibacter sp.]
MKKLIVVALVLAFGAGCAMKEEAYVLDREFGKAQMESWDKMIAYPHAPYAEAQPEGLEGIHAEPAMGVYHKSFAKEPTRREVFQLGIIGK